VHQEKKLWQKRVSLIASHRLSRRLTLAHQVSFSHSWNGCWTKSAACSYPCSPCQLNTCTHIRRNWDKVWNNSLVCSTTDFISLPWLNARYSCLGVALRFVTTSFCTERSRRNNALVYCGGKWMRMLAKDAPKVPGRCLLVLNVSAVVYHFKTHSNLCLCYTPWVFVAFQQQSFHETFTATFVCLQEHKILFVCNPPSQWHWYIFTARHLPSS